MATLCVRGSTPFTTIRANSSLRNQKRETFISLPMLWPLCVCVRGCTPFPTRRDNSSLRNQKRETFISLPMLWPLCVWGALVLLYQTKRETLISLLLFRFFGYVHHVRQTNGTMEFIISLPMLWPLCVWGALLLYHHTSQQQQQPQPLLVEIA